MGDVQNTPSLGGEAGRGPDNNHTRYLSSSGVYYAGLRRNNSIDWHHMREILRNMWRKKLRSFLTIVGIAVGIYAFTVMGSMAARFNKMIGGAKSYVTGQITLLPKGTSFSTGTQGAMLPLDVLDKIAQVEGVESASPSVELALEDPNPDDPLGGGASFGPPPMIQGTDLDRITRNRNWESLDMKEGRMLEPGDPDDVIVIGSSIALEKEVGVGDTMLIRGSTFTIIGVIERTLTGPDTYIFMPIAPAREMFVAANPFLKSLKEQSDQASNLSEEALAALPEAARNQLIEARAFKIENINTGAAVAWKDDFDPEVVVNNIKDQFKDDVLVLSPQKLGEQIDKASAVFNALILGSALIALVVGGFSIINTMVMSISERTREIGIKKALGASRKSIAREYTLEAGIIGFFGGIIGMGFGLLTIVLLNNQMGKTGAEIFLLDPGLLAGVIIFSFALGIMAGLIPAIRASRMKAVEAIREL